MDETKTEQPTTTFRDVKGREYVAFISVGVAIRLRKELQIDLNKITERETIARLHEDPEVLVGALWMMVEESAKAQSIEPVEFGESLGGDTLEAAFDAMQEAIILFTRRSMRTVLRALAEKGRKIEELATEQALQEVAKIDPAVALTSFDTATSKPPSVESAPPT